MAQITRTSLAEQAADMILERVRAGEWPLGSKLPGENTLGPQLGVGRSTVREAIRRLAGQGVLTTRQGAGVFVAALDVVEDWEGLLRRADIVEVIEARTAIEAEAAFLAAERRTAADLRAMRRTLSERDIAVGIEAHVDADAGFHRAVIVAAHNAVLLEMFDRFVPRIREAMIAMLRIRGDYGDPHDQNAHAVIVTAIEAQDASAAASLARDHLRSLRAAVS
ncbi:MULTISPECIES: FadR/GntR family transcriptional regulator [unclassified Leucobacter]|uniref:FadR/GntR family transcriptional regulator n=1 Tax=unclassified Leucobacter TaxID=2621730 RepID=UPI00301B2826